MKKWFIIIAVIVMVGLPTLWGVHVSMQLSQATVSMIRPHDYEDSLEQVISSSNLIKEDRVGYNAFFYAHIGYAHSMVWQDPRVLENFKRMYQSGVDIKITASSKGYNNESSPCKKWTEEFGDCLVKVLDIEQEELKNIYRIIPNKLRNCSVVSGSDKHSEAYITSHEDMNIYSTSYFKVRDQDGCKEWKNYLLMAFEQKGSTND